MKSKSRHKTVTRNCENCSKEFVVRESRVLEGMGRFCSRACNYTHKREHTRKPLGKENGRKYWDKAGNRWMVHWYDHSEIKHVTTYAKWYWELNKGEIPEGHYPHFIDGDSKNISPDNLYLKSPKEIGDEISQRLMGHSVSKESREKMGRAKAGKPLPEEHRNRIGESVKKRWEDGRFDMVHVGENHRRFRADKGTYPKEFSPELKRRVRIRYADTCQSCGERKFKRGGIHVHHINGDKNNNDYSNLTVLCSSCHMLVHETSSDISSKIREFRSLLLYH